MSMWYTLLFRGLLLVFGTSKKPDFSGFGWLDAVYLGVTVAVTLELETPGLNVRAAT